MVVRRRNWRKAQVPFFWPLGGAGEAAASLTFSGDGSRHLTGLLKTSPSSATLTVLRFFMRLMDRLMSVLVEDQLRRRRFIWALAASANREIPAYCSRCERIDGSSLSFDLSEPNFSNKINSALELICIRKMNEPERDSGRSRDVSDVVSSPRTTTSSKASSESKESSKLSSRLSSAAGLDFDCCSPGLMTSYSAS